jgi:hypothetical protein
MALTPAAARLSAAQLHNVSASISRRTMLLTPAASSRPAREDDDEHTSELPPSFAAAASLRRSTRRVAHRSHCTLGCCEDGLHGQRPKAGPSLADRLAFLSPARLFRGSENAGGGDSEVDPPPFPHPSSPSRVPALVTLLLVVLAAATTAFFFPEAVGAAASKGILAGRGFLAAVVGGAAHTTPLLLPPIVAVPASTSTSLLPSTAPKGTPANTTTVFFIPLQAPATSREGANESGLNATAAIVPAPAAPAAPAPAPAAAASAAPPGPAAAAPAAAPATPAPTPSSKPRRPLSWEEELHAEMERAFAIVSSATSAAHIQHLLHQAGAAPPVPTAAAAAAAMPVPLPPAAEAPATMAPRETATSAAAIVAAPEEEEVPAAAVEENGGTDASPALTALTALTASLTPAAPAMAPVPTAAAEEAPLPSTTPFPVPVSAAPASAPSSSSPRILLGEAFSSSSDGLHAQLVLADTPSSSTATARLAVHLGSLRTHPIHSRLCASVMPDRSAGGMAGLDGPESTGNACLSTAATQQLVAASASAPRSAFTIEGLRPGALYSVSVTIMDMRGRMARVTFPAMLEEGMLLQLQAGAQGAAAGVGAAAAGPVEGPPSSEPFSGRHARVSLRAAA